MCDKVKIDCPNEHCDGGVVMVVFGEDVTCGICNGNGEIEIPTSPSPNDSGAGFQGGHSTDGFSGFRG